MKRRGLKRRHGHASSRGVFTVVSGGYHNTHRTRRAALDEAAYLERRGYEPIVYEYNEAKPDHHRKIIHGSGRGQVAPSYRGHARHPVQSFRAYDPEAERAELRETRMNIPHSEHYTVMEAYPGVEDERRIARGRQS